MLPWYGDHLEITGLYPYAIIEHVVVSLPRTGIRAHIPSVSVLKVLPP